MEIIDFIRSKTVKDYIKELEYKFSMLQAFMLIWGSGMEDPDKLEYYERIIENYEDMEVVPSRNSGLTRIKSLKDFIRDLIRTIKREHVDTARIPYYFYFELPCPFKRGDILKEVIHPRRKEARERGGKVENTFYLVDRIQSWDRARMVEEGIKNIEGRFKNSCEIALANFKSLAGFYDSLGFDGYAYEEKNYSWSTEKDKYVILPNNTMHHNYHYFGNGVRFIDLDYANEEELVGPQQIILLFKEYLLSEKNNKYIPLDLILKSYDIMRNQDDEDQPYRKNPIHLINEADSIRHAWGCNIF